MTRGEELAQVLDQARAYSCRYVAFPSPAAADAFTLWIAHAHAIEAFDSTPRFGLLSAEKQSGKTRAQEVAELLVPRPLVTVNVSSSALFRSIPQDGAPPTILFDEIDTVFGPKAPEGSEDLRGLLNAGHRRGRPVLRCTGPTHAVAEFPSFAPVMLAGIGDLPDTVADRTIVVRMRRRAPDEMVESFRSRTAEAEATPIKEWFVELTPWMVDQLTDSYPTLPSWLTDRPADVWEPIIAVADLAGSDWADRARDAAHAFVGQQNGNESVGVRLLADIRDAFGDRDRLSTSSIVAGLTAVEDAPWGDWLEGKSTDAQGRWLARKLKPYGITSTKIRFETGPAKGYFATDFADAWDRYLPEKGNKENKGNTPASDVPLVPHVPHCVRDGCNREAAPGSGGLCIDHHADTYGATP